MNELRDPELYFSIFALVTAIWILFREIKTRARISAITFCILSILGLCALILDMVLEVFNVYDSGIDVLLDYIRYTAGAAIALLIIFIGFMYGDENQLFWTKLFTVLLILIAIAFGISIYL